MAEEAHDSSLVSVETTPQMSPRYPDWFPEAALTAQAWSDTGLRQALQLRVQVPRGRLGLYETCDFVLVLLAYAVSGERTLKDFFAALTVGAVALAALWGRDRLPSASALSRFLGSLPQAAVEALRTLLFEEQVKHGMPTERMGGLYDRTGALLLFFDGDGTKAVARQRALVQDEQHPPPRRRLDKLMAAGYAGRKRGEGVRNRMTVQQAHTREWLGTFGQAGNGDTYGDLKRVCQNLVVYLQARGVALSSGVLRLDGLYGYVRGAWIISQHGLGYLMRGVDYRLLEDPRVRARLEQPPDGSFTQPDTATTRSVYEVGEIEWRAAAQPQMKVKTRLLVTARPLSAGPVKVGKKVGEVVYELFVTDRSAEQLSANDVLSLYFARGGFEQTLAEEDREQEPDRWCSGHPQGQEAWQLLSQWVWNFRLRLGVAAQPQVSVRRTMWAEALPPEAPWVPQASGEPAPPPPAPGPPPAEPPATEADSDSLSCCPPQSRQAPPLCPVQPSCDPAPAKGPPADKGPEPPAKGSPADKGPEPPPMVQPPADPAPAQGELAGKGLEASPVFPSAKPSVGPPPHQAPPVKQQSPIGPLAPMPVPSQTPPQLLDPVLPSGPMRGTVALASGRGAGRFGGSDFRWQPDGTLTCPAGKPLHPAARRLEADRERILFQARPRDCSGCPLSSQCRGISCRSSGGRTVSVLRPLAPQDPTQPPKPPEPQAGSPSPIPSPSVRSRGPGPLPVYWDDLPATSLRRTLSATLRHQNLEVTLIPLPPPPLVPPPPLTRAQRAHRRRTWAERLARNSRSPHAPSYKTRLFGVPSGVNAYLDGFRLRRAA
jgi:hypothetical protein